MILEILGILAAISMVVGGLLSLSQWDFKRLLAYSSISQVGYILLGLAIGTPLSIMGAILHIINHGAMKSLLFLTAGAVEYSTGTRDFYKLGGLKEKMPLTFIANMAASMSISGIPPFGGFFSKLVIIMACIKANHYGYAGWAVFSSILTFAAILKMQRYVFFGNPSAYTRETKEVPLAMAIPMLLLAVICLLLGLLLLPEVKAVVLDPATRVVLGAAQYANYIIGN